MRALLDLRSWKVIHVEDDEGRRWRVEGSCEGCPAPCCVKGEAHCEHWDNGCQLQAKGGAAFLKPAFCLLWPFHPRHLEAEPDCRLRMVEIGDGE